jgi:hypothetical protein
MISGRCLGTASIAVQELLGVKRAADALLTGQTIDAKTAHAAARE